MKLIDLLQKLPGYHEMLANVPEADRPAALAALEEQIAPLERLVSILPGDVWGKMAAAANLNQPQQASHDDDPKPARRQPRRF